MCLLLENESETERECESVRLTFVFLLGQPSLLHLLGRLHEEWEDGPEPQDVHKLMAVVGPLGSGHAVVQDLQGAGSGHLLLSAGRERKTRLGSERVFRTTIFIYMVWLPPQEAFVL